MLITVEKSSPIAQRSGPQREPHLHKHLWNPGMAKEGLQRSLLHKDPDVLWEES